jgi:farnesyl-diphosphate farnesyltransferase
MDFPMDIFALADRTARSFALTLRLLPRPVRGEICLAYLLARASDTIADAPGIPADDRLRLLATMATALARPGNLVTGDAFEDNPAPSTIAASIAHSGEAELLRAWPQLVSLLRQQPPDAQSRVQSVLTTIISGQSLDVERFGHNDGGCLPDDAALVDYTWRVAGCVGEFWTDVLAGTLPRALAKPAAEMRALGRLYGQGLQLLNILRDAPADLAHGRCYLPPSATGDANHAPPSMDSLHARMTALIPRCREWLDAGTNYGQSLRGARVRAASRLPARLAHLTLDALAAASPDAWRARIKIPRPVVKRLAISTVLGAFIH